MNPEQLLAHYDRIADAPDAVARLRHFVLDLAVRGKLMAQDPHDLPAADLLNQIAAARAKLVSASELPPIDLSEAPFKLPAGWYWSRIGALCTKTGSGSTPRGGQSAYQPSGVAFLRSQNIYNDGLRLDDVVFIDSATHDRMSGTAVQPGDLLLNITGGSLGRCCRVPDVAISANVSQHVAIIRPAVAGMSDFLHCLVLSPYFQGFVIGEQTGAGRGGLPKNRMDRIIVPLPPLAEQHRIVAKVDELMALCDRLEAARAAREATRDRLAVASLARLNSPDPETFQSDARFALDTLPSLTTRPDQVKQIRQSVLNLAVRGFLSHRDSNDEPVDRLLGRAMDAKARAHAREELRDRQSLPAPVRGDLAFEFPATWGLASFDDLFVIVSGVTKGQRIAAHEAVDVPYLRVANVQRGYLDLSVIKTISVRRSDALRYALEHGDVLMTEGGDWDKLGRAAIWRQEVVGCIHQNHIFRIRVPSGEVLSEWIVLYTNSPLGRRFFENASKQTTNLASINMTQLRGFPIPIPPLAEQHRIVAKVDELMALCDRLEATLTTASDTRRRALEALLVASLSSDSECSATN